MAAKKTEETPNLEDAASIFEQFESIKEEERESYDLAERLAGTRNRTITVTVYTDEEAGAELGGVEDVRGFGGVVIDRRRWGLLGELEVLQETGKFLKGLSERTPVQDRELERIAGEITRISEEYPKIMARLNATAYTFELQSLNKDEMLKVGKEARLSAGIKGNNKVPAKLEDKVAKAGTDILLQKSVKRWADHSAKLAFTELTREQAAVFREMLPATEYERLDKAITDLSIQRQIAESITDTPDFS